MLVHLIKVLLDREPIEHLQKINQKLEPWTGTIFLRHSIFILPIANLLYSLWVNVSTYRLATGDKAKSANTCLTLADLTYCDTFGPVGVKGQIN